MKRRVIAFFYFFSLVSATFANKGSGTQAKEEDARRWAFGYFQTLVGCVFEGRVTFGASDDKCTSYQRYEFDKAPQITPSGVIGLRGKFYHNSRCKGVEKFSTTGHLMVHPGVVTNDDGFRGFVLAQLSYSYRDNETGDVEDGFAKEHLNFLPGGVLESIEISGFTRPYLKIVGGSCGGW